MIKNKKYDAGSIEIFEGLEAVRKRPGMYIGGLDEESLHKMLFEVVENSLDEFSSGYATKIDVVIREDGYAEVSDDGRGIPVKTHALTGLSALEVVLSKLHAGGKFSDNDYKFAAGLHGVGLSVVNALSDKLRAEVCRDGHLWTQEYEKGQKISEVQRLTRTSKTGTKIIFRPDYEMFKDVSWCLEIIQKRLREMSDLYRVKVSLDFKNHKSSFSNGSIDNLLPDIDKLLSTNVHVNVDGLDSHLDLCFNYAISSGGENFMSFVNGVNTNIGGSHVLLVKGVLTKFFLDAYRNNAKGEVTTDDVRNGIMCVLHLKIKDPIFSGQTKGKFVSDLKDTKLQASAAQGLFNVFLDRKDDLKALIKRFADNATRRKSIENIVNIPYSKDIVDSSALPGKLAECSSRNKEERELFIVEGDSAGGTAKQARDREFQAILSLRGKCLNVEKSNFKRISTNAELKDMSLAISGGRIGKEFTIDSLRYGKIIIMSDADPDGHHIRVLFLIFFFRFFPDLIRHERLYVALPPIYLIKHGKERQYFYDEATFRTALEALAGKKVFVQRFKGLGEMNASELRDTTMIPHKRKILKVLCSDFVEADKKLHDLLGDDSTVRKNSLLDYIKEIKIE